MPYKDKKKQREYQKKWIAKRRSDFFEDKVCEDCDSIESLELHHIDPSNKVTHRIWSFSESKRLEEISKCKILCEQCHNTQHERKCGTPQKYDVGCRCIACTKANTIRKRKSRSKSFSSEVEL